MAEPPIDWATRIGRHLNLADATIAESRNTTRLNAVGAFVESAIERFTGRKLAYATFDELYDGNGKAALFLNQDPVVSVSLLTVNGAAVTVGSALTYPPAAVMIDGERQALRYTNGVVFAEGVANVRVTYVAGLQIPEGLVMAGVEWAAELWKRGTWAAAQRQPSGGGGGSAAAGSPTFDAIPPRILSVIAGYRRAWKP